MSSSFNFDVIIAGGGPAGSSAAIHLAMRGTRVLLAEQKKFPRAKLCGEFISPNVYRTSRGLAFPNRLMQCAEQRLGRRFFTPAAETASAYRACGSGQVTLPWA